MRRETFKFWDLARLIFETLRYMDYRNVTILLQTQHNKTQHSKPWVYLMENLLLQNVKTFSNKLFGLVSYQSSNIHVCQDRAPFSINPHLIMVTIIYRVCYIECVYFESSPMRSVLWCLFGVQQAITLHLSALLALICLVLPIAKQNN